MTKVINGVGYIAPEPDGTCELCGKTAEVRPYGENSKKICFECGQKDPEMTRKMMNQNFFDKLKPVKPNQN